MTTKTEQKQVIVIKAVKYKLVEQDYGTRTIEMTFKQFDKYCDGLLREYESRGYSIHAATKYNAILIHHQNNHFVELTFSKPSF
jgi:hypothetical protein